MTLRGARLTMLVVPATIYFVSYFHRVAPAVVAADLMRAFAIGAAALGSLAAIYPYVFAAMALVAGSLADTLGPRWTLTLGAVTMGLGAVVFGLAPTFGLAFVGRLLVGLGASVVLIAWLALAAEWFRPGEFGTVSGFTQAVGNAGALVASSPLALLVDAAGWRLTFVLIGAGTLGLAALSAALVRDHPAALGLGPVNAERAGRRPPRMAEALRSIPGVAANARTWPPIVVAGGTFLGLLTFMGLWGVPYLAQVYGLRRVDAASVVAAAPLGLCLGSPLVGWLSDRWLRRRRLPMVVFAALYAASWSPLVMPADLRLPVGTLLPFVFVMGLAGSGMVLLWPCVREVNDPERVGVAVGFVNVPIFLGVALMQWLTGVVLDAHWTGLAVSGSRVYPPEGYRAVFGLCLGLAVLALAASFVVTETRCRNVWRASA